MVQIKTHVDNETPKATESKGSQSKRLPRKYIAPQQGFFRETDDASDVAVSDPAPIDVELDKSAPYEDTDKVFLTELRDKLATLKKRVAVLVEQIQQLSTVKRKAALADLESALETLLLKYHLPSDGLEEEPSALIAEAKNETTGKIGLYNTPFPPLPDVAPKLWEKRDKWHMSPVAFILNVYGKWLGSITLDDIRDLDPLLAKRYNNWILAGNNLPDGFSLPSQSKMRAAVRGQRRKIRHAVP